MIIYYLQELFTYLDRFFTRIKRRCSLCCSSISHYEAEFFLPFKEKLYEKLNKLIRDDRNGYIESRNKIKKILEIINYLDISKAKIIINENREITILLDGYNAVDKKLRKKEWIENYFMKETIKYLEEKVKNDMKNLSVNDYIDTQLKYLKEENERKQLYIYPQFHEQLDKLNYFYLIGNNSKELLNKSIGNSVNKKISIIFHKNLIDDIKIIKLKYDNYVYQKNFLFLRFNNGATTHFLLFNLLII